MILELELELFEHLSLNNIRYIKWTIKEIVQILLGTNGSGKSAIMSELSPLPADKNHYYKGGKKRILISENGKLYELISDFTNNQDHYFYCDGENLNPGRTVTIQRELVKEHFNLTEEKHQILLGREKFTKMSAARRKELFMQACIVDYTYAIKLYKQITDEMNSMKNGVKLAKDRLGKEAVLTISEVELLQMRERLSTLTKESQDLYVIKNAYASTVADSTNALKIASNAIFELKERFSSLRKSVGNKAYISPDEYQADIDNTKVELTSINTLYSRLSDDFIKLGAELGNSEDLVGENAVALQEVIINDNKLAESLLSRRKKPLEGLDAVAASTSMDLVYETLVEVLTQLPSDPESKLTGAALNSVTEQLSLLTTSLRVNKDKLAALEHQEQHYLHLEQGDAVECPKCDHRFKVGYNLEVHEGLQKRIIKGREIVAELTAAINKAAAEQEQLVSYATLYKEYIRVTRNTPQLQPLWSLIASDDSIKQSPQNALSTIELVRNDLFLELQVSAIKDKVKTNLQRLKLIEHAKSTNIKEIKAKQQSLEQEIGYLSNRKVTLQRELQAQTTLLQQIKAMHDTGDKLRLAQEALDNKSYALIESLKNEVIDQALVVTHSEIAVLSTRINTIEQQASVIRDIHASITSYEAQFKAYKALADALSPTDGLIAEGMLGFIRNFVARLNALIAKVWTYRMEVFDCSTEADSAELNYKFPLATPNLSKPVKDVAFASSGQAEMIDLAFVVIYAQCAKLDHGPLFLDEFGKTFDKAHQEAATNVINQLMQQLNFTQLFMISHYESCYGSFYNAQFTVLDKRNITMPGNKKVNEHVAFAA